MKRLAFLAPLALAVLVMAPATAASPKSNWRALNDDLAPVNVALRDDIQHFGAALAEFGKDAQLVFFGSPFSRGTAGTAKKVIADLAQVQKTMDAVTADAKKGIAVLDSYAPEACSFHFTALEYTMFAAWVTTMAELQANVGSGAPGAAIWLSGTNPRDLSPLVSGGPIDVAWSQVRCQGASPSPAPSTSAGSPTPS